MDRTQPRASSTVLDKKRTVLLLRSVVVISTSYLILFGPQGTDRTSVAYIAAILVSNVALLAVPRGWFHRFGFSAFLLLGDTAVVLVGLFLTVGCFSQDFLIIYFFTIFLTTATQGLAQIATGAAMVSGLYGYWLWISNPAPLGAAEWLRLPFFFIVAVFYAYMTEETKQERWRRQQAERESAHLRFLLTLGTSRARPAMAHEFLNGIGPLMEAAFPRLRCALQGEPAADDGGGIWIPVQARGLRYGGLHVTAVDGLPLEADERQFCRVVAQVAANALYTAAQVRAACDSERVKHEFLGTLSHELRTPLHAILGYAEMLQAVLEEHPDVRVGDSLDRLRHNACRMQDLVEDMLGLAQLLSGERAVEIERVHLPDVFGGLAADVGAVLAERPVRFLWSVAPEAAAVRTDPLKLRQILRSLLSNAAKFTECGVIRLTAERTAMGVTLVIEDTGIGIDTTDLDKIFEAFRQADGSLTRRFEGLGLGLALVRELVEALGGTLAVESRVGVGTTIRVLLPDAQPAPQRTEHRPAAHPVSAVMSAATS